MPDLVKRDDNPLGRHGRLGKLTGFIPNPVQHGNIADPENAGDAAETHVAHRIQQQRQRLHLRRLAPRRRIRETAPAGPAFIALQIPNDPALDVIRSLTAFADDRGQGSLLLRRTTPFCTSYP